MVGGEWKWGEEDKICGGQRGDVEAFVALLLCGVLRHLGPPSPSLPLTCKLVSVLSTRKRLLPCSLVARCITSGPQRMRLRAPRTTTGCRACQRSRKMHKYLRQRGSPG